MRVSKYSEQQIIGFLNRATAGEPVAGLAVLGVDHAQRAALPVGGNGQVDRHPASTILRAQVALQGALHHGLVALVHPALGKGG